jgi:predicted small integral membrane protein
MIEARIVKVIMVGCLAVFALLVAFNNLTDYDMNYLFVQHVLSMDALKAGSPLLYRRINSPAMWQAGYALIIAGEALTGAALTAAAIAMLRRLRADARSLNRAKRFVLIGAALGFLLWFFGFMVVGGEWFQMWRSPDWNGQESAFRFYMTILAVLIFVNQRDDELVTPADGSASGGGPG